VVQSEVGRVQRKEKLEAINIWHKLVNKEVESGLVQYCENWKVLESKGKSNVSYNCTILQ
jgi:hypothetical protein